MTMMPPPSAFPRTAPAGPVAPIPALHSHVFVLGGPTPVPAVVVGLEYGDVDGLLYVKVMAGGARRWIPANQVLMMGA